MKRVFSVVLMIIAVLLLSEITMAQSISIGVAAGVAQPTDQELKNSNLGFNVGIQGFYHLNDHLWAGARLAFDRWTPDLPGRDVEWLDYTGSTTVIELTPAIRYVAVIPETKDHIFAQAGFGFFMRKDKLEITDVAGAITETTEDKNGLGMNIGAGFDFKFLENVQVEILPLYNMVFDKISKGTCSSRYYTLSLGLLF